MRKKLMILGAGTYQKPLIEYAARYYEVVLVAPNVSEYLRHSVRSWYPYDIRAEKKILEAAKYERIDGIITDQTDIPVRTISYVANQLGLPGNPYDVACIYTDKEMMRTVQARVGIPILPHASFEFADEAAEYFSALGSDAIIKPIDNQGSRGVASVRSVAELRQKFQEAKHFSSCGRVMVEKRATGRQFAVEGVAFNGKFKSLICSDDDYFEFGDCFAARSRVFNSVAPKAIYDKVIALNDRINSLFGLQQGLSHAEYIMDGDEVYLIEVGARGGGAYISSDMIPRLTGLNTAEFLCQIACGEIDKFPEVSCADLTVGYVAFYLPEGTVESLEGIQEVLQLPYVHRNTLSSIYVGRHFGSADDKTTRQLMVVSARDRGEWDKRIDVIRSKLRIRTKGLNGEKLDPIW